jgi:hypothetical protein
MHCKYTYPQSHIKPEKVEAVDRLGSNCVMGHMRCAFHMSGSKVDKADINMKSEEMKTFKIKHPHVKHQLTSMLLLDK